MQQFKLLTLSAVGASPRTYIFDFLLRMHHVVETRKENDDAITKVLFITTLLQILSI